jgi:hypothetical protein
MPLFAAKRSLESRDIVLLRSKIKKQKEDVQYLQSSVRSLDDLQSRLSKDLHSSEREFSYRFSRLLIPLLNWPEIAMAGRSTSWVEKEHLELLMDRVRAKIVGEPLEMIADRDLKLKQSESLRLEFAEALKALKSKEALLDLQLEELQQFERRSAKSKKKFKEEPSEEKKDTL